MTTRDTRQFTPLLLQKVGPAGRGKWPADPADLTPDPLPAAVDRHPDGRIASRHTYMTEVDQETTDDN